MVQHIQKGTRAQFLENCHLGIYDGTLVIARTVDSIQARSYASWITPSPAIDVHAGHRSF